MLERNRIGGYATLAQAPVHRRGARFRQELIALWRSPESGLSSVFMVTHNIEEAVEMATRIAVVFPRPGRVGLMLENHLPYPPRREAPRVSAARRRDSRVDHDDDTA
jgi:ABC-type nitrate/sulfonate/bicarbonate transport system ATPase subunit